MIIKNILTIAMLTAFSAVGNAQQLAAHFNMTVSDGEIVESVSKQSFTVNSALPAFDVEGLNGRAMRFDGYSNYVETTLTNSALSTSNFSVNVVLAPETYPMMNTAEAENTPTYATVCGNLDETAKAGFAIQLSSQGHFRFRFASAYAKGYIFTIESAEKLPCGIWSQITAVLDKDANLATLFLNGRNVGTCKMSRSEIIPSTGSFYIGKDATEVKAGPFLINTFCGLVDEISLYNESLTNEQVTALAKNLSSGTPDFNYPAERYLASLWRPQFHGMPSGGWTNETHGMTFSNGKYHLFFQKNANGPYMARLHWGHISSENLYKWTEEPIAIAPGEAYDIKGCWSGCVYDDDNGINAIYTAVDNGKARIVKATPDDKGLMKWTKQGVIIEGRPTGLSDDFRDPYFFTSGGNKYIIVGTSKDGIGACTLHKYDNGNWTNDGKMFFRGTNVAQHGTFWEMPNVTALSNGKWLFTVTPLGMSTGVKTIYWIGTINPDGTFAPDSESPKTLELNGISKEGYGLLSPTILNHDGKTLMLGIVPDKISGERNYSMGWAHNYSLPREIWLDKNGEMCQKPYSGLAAMRTETSFNNSFRLIGSQALDPVTGRQLELIGKFTVGVGEVGFRFLKNNDRYASLSYDAATGVVSLDLSRLERVSNDAGTYNGVCSASLPERLAVGETLVLHMYLDGSIVDVFVNERFAFSVRLFPTDVDATATEVFSTTDTEVNVSAWVLNANSSSHTSIASVSNETETSRGIFALDGTQIKGTPKRAIFIVNGKKYVAN